MGSDRSTGVVPRITSSLGAASSWVRGRLPWVDRPTSGRLLADDDHEPARFALSQLQEQPSFDADDRKRQFAMLDDVDERDDASKDVAGKDVAGRAGAAAKKPRPIEETEAAD